MSNYKKDKVRPLLFSTEPRAQPGEEFVRVEEDPKYSISNFGRVKVHRKSGTKIIIPYRRAGGSRFSVRLSSQILVSVSDLVYKAFIGEIENNKKVSFLDANTRNLKHDNLTLVDYGVRRKRRSGTKYNKKNKLVIVSKHKEINVPYTIETKKQALKDLNTYLKGGYYVAFSETWKDGGYYFLRLKTPK